MKTLFSGKIFTIPNLLSVLRICMIPWLIWTYLARGDNTGAALILLLSGLTDIVDGFIARRFNMVSNLGKALDPLADKLTQAAMVVCLMLHFPHLLRVLITMIFKEILMIVLGLRAINKTENVMSSAWHGKAATVLIYLTMVCHLLISDIPYGLSESLIWLCVGMILLSGVLYAQRYINAAQGRM